jgi:hypothetical protein
MVFDSYRDNLYIRIESAGARANLTHRLEYVSDNRKVRESSRLFL